METRFILPATVAASLHLALLFGFHSADEIVTSDLTVVARTKPVIRITEPFYLDPNEPSPNEAASQTRRGDTLVPRPENPEPDFMHDESKIAQPTTSWRAAPDIVAHDIIPTGTLGVRDGVEFSDRIGPPCMPGTGHLDNPPRTRVQQRPVYPTEARREGRAGEVLVDFGVDELGVVHDVCVVRSTDVRFERPTLQAVAGWRFEPGRKNGRVTRFRMQVPVEFSLNE